MSVHHGVRETRHARRVIYCLTKSVVFEGRGRQAILAGPILLPCCLVLIIFFTPTQTRTNGVSHLIPRMPASQLL